MKGDMNLRASDADRDQVAAALREHLAAGRLTTEEFDERLGQAFAAKTLGDLQGVTADLPGTDLEQFQDMTTQRPTTRPVEKRPDGLSPARRAVWQPWLVVTLVLFVLWLFSGAAGGPWFVYLAVLAGVVLLLRRRRGPPRGRREVRTHGDHRELGE